MLTSLRWTGICRFEPRLMMLLLLLSARLRVAETENGKDSPHTVSKFNYSYLLYSGGALLFTLLSCCIKCCCSTKSSTEKGASEPEDAVNEEPASYDSEPVGGMPPHPAETLCLVQPVPVPTGPLVHNPTADPPPAYSEVSAPAAQVDPQAVLLDPGHECQFELKGYKSLLSSDSPHGDVYTSDKLNFL